MVWIEDEKVAKLNTGFTYEQSGRRFIAPFTAAKETDIPTLAAGFY